MAISLFRLNFSKFSFLFFLLYNTSHFFINKCPAIFFINESAWLKNILFIVGKKWFLLTICRLTCPPFDKKSLIEVYKFGNIDMIHVIYHEIVQSLCIGHEELMSSLYCCIEWCDLDIKTSTFIFSKWKHGVI